MPYRIQYSPEAEEHLSALSSYYRRLVLDSVEEQLLHQPTVTTRNRKPMQPNPLASWELRIGNLRVYYDVEESLERVVDVLAVGVKEGNTVRIAGKVIKL